MIMESYYKRKKRSKITPLIVLAVIVHVLLLLSVLDIYFTSPLEHGLKHHKPQVNKPAKRLVLLVADGLRASAIYSDDMSSATPFLYKIKESVGTWGIAHTQVPTESRPGHIALLAGFYEDPSAIFKGWQSNPVDFDTVINQSRKSICFGSPDIVHMFNKYNYSHISSFSYDPSLEDFSGKWKSVVLDQWVFEKAYHYIKNGKIPDSEKELLMFLHLLGIDTAGHSFKPLSRQYKLNIMELDKEISDFVDFFNSYYRDNDTTFLFTADHGMTNWGSHGAGSKDETEVPFIAWGSGISKSSIRKDLNLTDVAPLIASLLGINIPTNSLGVVPLKFLDLSLEDLAHIAYTNALQLGELLKAKEEKIKNNPIFIFKPFLKISEESFLEWQSTINKLFKSRDYQNIIKSASSTIEELLEGIRYYNNYFEIYLSILVTLAFIGWLLYLVSWLPIFSLIYVSYEDWNFFNAKEKEISTVFLYFNCLCLMISFIIGYFYTYLLYVLFPVSCWYLFYVRSAYLKILQKWLMNFKLKNLLFYTFGYMLGLQMLIFTFYHKQSLVPVILSNVWYICKFKRISFSLSLIWIGINIVTCCMLFLPVMNTGYSFWCLLISFFMTAFSMTCLFLYCKSNKNITFFKKNSTYFQIIYLIGAYLNTFFIKLNIQRGYGLHPLNQAFSWSILGASVLVPLVSPESVGYRLISIMMGLIPVYILLSGGIEPIFIITFSIFTLTWVLVEKEISNQNINIWTVSFKNYKRNFDTWSDNRDDIRKAFTLFSFILVAFFGTGNLSSINSFDPTWTQTFITVFKPHTMMALITLKITIPFLILMCCFMAIVKITNIEIKHVFTLLLFFCDLMVLQFFFAVKNHGSWLEIGMSLSRFIIALVTTLTALLFYFVAKILTTTTMEQLLSLIKIN